jgi:hypothetical protein
MLSAPKATLIVAVEVDARNGTPRISAYRLGSRASVNGSPPHTLPVN